MQEELGLPATETSLRDYVDLLRRRKYIVLQTFVLVLMVGTIVTFLTKPVYRTGARILVEGKEFTVAQYNTSDPLSNLFMPDVGHDIATQIEVLQSDKVMSEAFQAAGVGPNDVTVDIKQVASTDVIEILAESNKAEFAERMARVLPTTYLKYMTGNRKAEILNALTSSRAQLVAEKEKLSQAELDIQHFKQQTHLPDVTVDKAQKINEAGTTEAEVKRAQAEVASVTARLTALKADRQQQPDFVDSPTTVSNNAALQAVKDQITQLKNDRIRLLGLYKPDAFPIQQMDTQIAQQEQRLADTPESVTTITRAPNPVLGTYDQRVSEAQAALSAAQAQLDKQQNHAQTAMSALGKYSTLDRRQAELQRNLEEHQTNVKTLTGTVQMLDLRDKATHDPLMTITPAGPATQVAPRVAINIAYSAVVGLILALALALLQEFLDDRINSLDDARRLLQTPVPGLCAADRERGRPSAQRGAQQRGHSGSLPRGPLQCAVRHARFASLLAPGDQHGSGRGQVGDGL